MKTYAVEVPVCAGECFALVPMEKWDGELYRFRFVFGMSTMCDSRFIVMETNNGVVMTEMYDDFVVPSGVEKGNPHFDVKDEDIDASIQIDIADGRFIAVITYEG